jgi:acyl phosphate:glycerol-3-phosphate acyltransferase
MQPYFLTIAVSYLLGSIPFGYLLVRMFLGKDIRESGSGNIGATNVARSSSGLGVATLALDALKGAGAVGFAMWLARAHANWFGAPPDQFQSTAEMAQRFVDSAYLLGAMAALFAIVGHIFPVWLRFHGGKGVATAVGSFVLLAPQAVLASLVVFLLIVLTARYVSLASILAAGTFPLFAWYFYRGVFPTGVVTATTIAALLVIGRHYQNIDRLMKGIEPRFQLRRG